ncbi:actin-binding Rho-activating protein-like [Brevipalpus obovatus]|uniref:actin-binding Rho-activating protein-like n=1 Tax=Brevipalpus obovatus TaxID=246614 RepID=UPI003D9EFB74
MSGEPKSIIIEQPPTITTSVDPEQGQPEFYVPLLERVSNYQKRLEAEQKKLEKPCKDKENYGKPIEGSKTQLRGMKAYHAISKEVQELCQIVNENGGKQKDGTVTMTFGNLFELYSSISDKLVGVLLRARKHGFVHFVGEILYQRRDDDVIITLVKMPPNDFEMPYCNDNNNNNNSKTFSDRE